MIFLHDNNSRARALRVLANGLSDARKYTAPIFGFLIATEVVDPVKLQVGVAASEATDFVDGYLGKKSNALAPNEKDIVDGKERDHKSDKWLFRSLMGGLAVRAVRNKEYKRALLYTGVALVQTARDYKVQGWRDNAIENGIDTGASNAARLKTVVNDLACVMALDNERHVPHSDTAADALFLGATALSISTMFNYKNSLATPVEHTERTV